MRIIALDTQVTEFDGIDWSAFEKLGDFVKYQRSFGAEIVERSKTAEAIVTNKVVFDAHVINALPNLKYIGVFATGINCVDLRAARQKNIAVTNVPNYSTDSVAQHTFAFILTEFSPILPYNEIVKAGQWATSPDFCRIQFESAELANKTLGIIGFGNIGRKVAELAKAFSMKVAIYSDHMKEDGKEFFDLETVLKKSDVISLHCSYTPKSEKLINANTIKFVKAGAILINVSRGGLVDEESVRRALQERKLKRYYTDVLSVEPPNVGNALIDEPKCILTPHVAWATHEARQRLLNESANNLGAFIRGEKRNRVDLA